MNKSIILLSGGLDSVVSLALIKEKCSNIIGLTFNYGQKSYFAEKKAAEQIAQYYKIEHKIIDLIITGDLVVDDDSNYIDVASRINLFY